MVVHTCIDDEDYIKKSEHGLGKRVILYFYWSGHAQCIKIKPLVDELCKKYNDTSIVFTYEFYNEDQLTPDVFEIKETPTFVVMDNGKELSRLTEADEGKIRQLFEKFAV